MAVKKGSSKQTLSPVQTGEAVGRSNAENFESERTVLLDIIEQLQDRLDGMALEIRLLESGMAASERRKDLVSDTQSQRESVLGALLLARCASEQDRIQTAIDGMNEHNGALEAAREELEKIKGSRSWKLTRPLRAFRRLFGSS